MSNASGKVCKGFTKSGTPCKAPPTEGGLCYFHANPAQARILGQKGGRNNRYQVTDVVVPEKLTMTGLGTVLDQAVGALLAGRMDPRVASALTQLINTRQRLTETVDLEARVTELERKLEHQGSAATDKASATAEEPDLPLWWMKENGKRDGGDGGGNNSKA